MNKSKIERTVERIKSDIRLLYPCNTRLRPVFLEYKKLYEEYPDVVPKIITFKEELPDSFTSIVRALQYRLCEVRPNDPINGNSYFNRLEGEVLKTNSNPTLLAGYALTEELVDRKKSRRSLLRLRKAYDAGNPLVCDAVYDAKREEYDEFYVGYRFVEGDEHYYVPRTPTERVLPKGKPTPIKIDKVIDLLSDEAVVRNLPYVMRTIFTPKYEGELNEVDFLTYMDSALSRTTVMAKGKGKVLENDNWLEFHRYREEVRKDLGLRIKLPPLNCNTYTLSGSVNGLTEEEVRTLISDLGGFVVSNVSSKVTAVIKGVGFDDKVSEAKSKGVYVIDLGSHVLDAEALKAILVKEA